MTSVIFFSKNAIGGFTPIDVVKFNTYDEALKFYADNKDKYRDNDVYLKLAVS